MARRQAIAIENNFTRGLITENTALNFPTNAATDTENCVFDHLGRVRRRGAFDIEMTGVISDEAIDDKAVFTEFVWSGVSGDGSISFMVQQIGSILHFYDISDELEPGNHKLSYEFDLSTVAVGSVNPGDYQCQYAAGNGDLIVVNPVCNPVAIIYDLDNNEFTTMNITVQERDFRGVDSVAPIGGSVSNVTPATGSLSWTLVNYVPFTIGETVTVYDLTNALLEDYMVGTVTDYNVGTKLLTLNITSVSGSTAASTSWGFVPERAINDFDRPYCTAAQLSQFFTSHYYNLLNQGWWLQILDTTNGPIHQWDTARTDLPSNNDTVGLYRASETDAFDPTRVTSRAPGNTPAARGHFILDVGDYRRLSALNSQLGVGDSTTTITTVTTTTIEQTLASLPTISGGMVDSTYPEHDDNNLGWQNGSAAFDTNTTQDTTNCAYIDQTISGTGPVTSDPLGDVVYRLGLGKNFGASNKKRIKQVIVSPASGSGWYEDLGSGSGSSFSTVDIHIRGSNTAPTDTTFHTTGTLLGSVTGRNRTSTTNAVFTITNTSKWQYVWAYITFQHKLAPASGFSQRIRAMVAEIRIWSEETVTTTTTVSTTLGSLLNDTTNDRFSCTAFFAGRVWYGGLNWQHLSNTIFFSQIIEKRNQYGRCYQQNDPTHESLYDLLSSDGGAVKIPEMGKLMKMFVYQNSLLLFATNGVWRVSGGGGFSATDYSIRKLSSLGTNSPMSFVDYEGIPVWWGDNSINTLIYNPDFDSFQVVSLSDETIKTFIQGIPVKNRRLVKGAYDRENKRIVWLYNSDSADEDSYTYDSMLFFNGITKAFFPWNTSSDTIKIRGVIHLIDPKATQASVIKYTTTDENTSLGYNLFFSYNRDDSWTDWVRYATEISLFPGKTEDYTSFFITGYRVDGEGARTVQQNYVYVFLEYETNGSCYMQGLYDFSNSGSNGRWGSSQEVYTVLASYDVTCKRLKVRGSGKALQLKFTSNSGKPFTIIGWSQFETANESI